MPYSVEHKARTRARIVEAARRMFNRFGFEQVSIDQIMADAKLTRGGFYNHFASKDELYAEAVASFRTCNPLAIKLAASKRPVPEPERLARMLVDLYLSDEVLDDPDKHCPLYALPSDVLRAGPTPQLAYTEIIRGTTHIFASALEGEPDAEQRAEAILSLCVGGMLLARTTSDEKLRKTLRASAKRQVLALLERRPRAKRA
ncbi:Transcriptional regulator, TetR family [Labilithrix luteola]|uniref:Transcriptional regulator, TetR family n=1 Tax=Labilithrix luteola TaxID=1391654 RepID=A0A0K1PJI9_9BACT|nr:TetR/AcrR family transcriptional regulator [Labilithrix luteola]AKU93576.1 Transcriptional regulator, TetR family [Labilithrix luteola]